MIPLSCFFVELVEILASLRLLDRELSLHLDTCLLREYRDRLSEVYLLDLHEEVDRTSSLTTREAMGNILGRRDDERWTLLIVKWAESLVVDACLLGRYISIDDIEYLDARFDVLSESHGENYFSKTSILNFSKARISRQKNFFERSLLMSK